jgi:TRAP-type C4-dicarboxylate transport system permease large subunit
MTSITDTRWGIMAMIIFILLVLGCFMEGIAVLVITIPVFMPLIERFHIDGVQFGIVMILCSMIGLLTPPVGMCLYAVSGISGVPIGRLSKELWPYLLGIFLVTLLIAYVPAVGLWLPNLLMPE